MPPPTPPKVRAQRLSVVDEMFLRTHHGLGTPVVMQGLWRGGDIDPDDLLGVHHALARGPLSRTVVRAAVPGARPRWRSGASPWPVEWSAESISRDAVTAWADAVARLPVDPEAGAGWRLAAARLTGGGTVVSLVCSHVLADARGLATLLAAAMAGTATPIPPDPSRPLLDDLSDACRMVTTVGARTVRAVAGLALHPSRATALIAGGHHPNWGENHARVPESLILDIDAAQWDTLTADAGGTPNSLLVAVAVGIATAGDAPLQVSVPIDRRRGAGPADNAIDMTEVAVRRGDSPARVRSLLRQAYQQPPMSSPAGFPPELLQLVPDRIAYRLAPDPGERDVLCSNVGTIPTALGALGGQRADAIATRAVHPGISARQLATSRTRLSAYLCRFGDRYTLALVSKDPGLRERTDTELAARGVRARHWDAPA